MATTRSSNIAGKSEIRHSMQNRPTEDRRPKSRVGSQIRKRTREVDYGTYDLGIALSVATPKLATDTPWVERFSHHWPLR